jgi:serine/threonine protein phosphatase PrpC
MSTFGQVTEEKLLPIFGKIRAEMVREACKIANFNDSAVVNTIETETLAGFLKAVQTKDEQLYDIICKANRPLFGTNINNYTRQMSSFADTLFFKLGLEYPDKKQDIEEMKSLYTTAIQEALVEVRKLVEQQHTTNTLAIDNEYKKALDSINKLQINNEQREEKLQEIEREYMQKLDEETEKYRYLQEQFETQITTYYTALISIFILVIAVLVVILFIFTRKRKFVQKKHSSMVVSNLNENTEQTIHTNPDPLVSKPAELPKPETSESELPKQPVKTPATNDMATFAVDADEWIVVGASVTGNGHVISNLPCQDSNKYEYWGDGWGIAIVSDGAGSAQNSHIGSKLVTHRGIVHFKTLVEREKWIQNNELPKDIDWFRHSYSTLKLIRNDIEQFAKKENYPLKSLNATVIVLIHSPYGILAVHVGDGRAGYKNEKGEWKALIIPHKGEEANQTIFLPSEFWNIPNYTMSGVLVPESVVVREKPFAFTLMSDGCENTAWQYYQMDADTGHYYDPNKPHPPFFNPLEATLQSFRNENVSLEERKNRWKSFIESGSQSFIKEQDDKTMILGVLYL